MTRQQNHPHRALLRTGLQTLFLTLILNLLPIHAQAEPCPRKLELLGQYYEKSDAVFLGTILADVGETKSSVRYRVKVQKGWKGIESGTVAWENELPPFVLLQDIHADGIPAGSKHQSGRQILIYAKKAEQGYFSPTFHCSSRYRILNEFGALEILYLDVWQKSLEKEEALSRLEVILGRLSGKFGTSYVPDYQIHPHPGMFEQYVSYVLGKLKGKHDRVYGAVAQILRVLAKRDKAVASSIWEVLKKNRWIIHMEGVGTDYIIRLVAITAYALSSSKKSKILKLVFPVLKNFSLRLNEDGYWYPLMDRGLENIKTTVSPELWEKINASKTSARKGRP